MHKTIIPVKNTLFICLSACFLALSCRQPAPLVDKTFADSLVLHYTPGEAVAATAKDIGFWRARIDIASTGMVNESHYAAALVARFHQTGDIRDVKQADSLLRKVSAAFNGKETGPLLALCRYAILQHRFSTADSLLTIARKDGLKPYDALSTSFDVDLELGRYTNATLYVQQLKTYKDYGYYFRLSRLDHLNGAMDSSIQAMLTAASLAESSVYLQSVALSNAADLYIHNEELNKAATLYRQCIRMNPADLHSITGLGWIALIHDKDTAVAKALFGLVHRQNQLPDPVFKLYQLAQAGGDSLMQLSYARSFEQQATMPDYGNMYNKYLLELYTGILHDPARAVAITAGELHNRSTPQTNAWYAWALFSAGLKDQAYTVYRESVSGKPLEGLELYYMGRLMEGLGKGYNAQQFYKAASKNKYDLSPGMATDLAKRLE